MKVQVIGHMDYEEWEPIYKKILSDFGYSEEKDKKSARVISEIRGSDGLSPLKKLEDNRVEVIGPFYENNISDENTLKIAAGSSAEAMVERGVSPDLLVTDLDGDTQLQVSLNKEGIPSILHAHGDNISLVKEWGEKFSSHVISTCQCEPVNETIYNFGGFTDGDRACFIADHFGAAEIVLNGWDFETPYRENEIKQKKLEWAKRLIERLNTPVSIE